jgi:hypothetical protein
MPSEDDGWQSKGNRNLTVSYATIHVVEGQQDSRSHTCIFGLESQMLGPADLRRKEKTRGELYERSKVWEIAPNSPVE